MSYVAALHFVRNQNYSHNYYGPYAYCSLDKGVAYTRGGGGVVAQQELRNVVTNTSATRDTLAVQAIPPTHPAPRKKKAHNREAKGKFQKPPRVYCFLRP